MESANNSRSCETTLKSPSKRITKQPSLSQTVYHGHRRTRWGCWLGAGLLLAAMAPSWASETLTGSFGKTRLQKNTGDAVEFTCGDLLGAGQTDLNLFSTCNAMVETARSLDPDISWPPENTDRSLGMTEDELAAAYQQIATEEYAAAGQMATEVGSNRINIGINRLIEVRRGARGFSIACLSPDSKTMLAADSEWMNSYAGKRG